MVTIRLSKGKVQKKIYSYSLSQTHSLLIHLTQFPNSNQAVVNLVNSAT